MLIKAFTSMDRKYFGRVGFKMIESFLKRWEGIELTVYWEGAYLPSELDNPNISIRYIEECTELNAFRDRNKDVPGNTPTALERGANRFAPKGFSVLHHLRTTNADKSVWLDADTFTHSTVTISTIDGLIPDNCAGTYLGRQGSYTETGFIGFNHRHVDAMLCLIKAYEDCYERDQVFNLPLWHDCMVFDLGRKNSGAIFRNLSSWGKGYNHVFVQSELGLYMDHMKGPRKDKGRSPKGESDLDIGYWT